ncbi:MAG TPA: G1 family glutamic endopeptidase [Reyranella sp.]
MESKSIPPGKLDDELANLVPVKAPPRSFDPLKASNEDLVEYAYPRRPPPESVEAYEIWRAVVAGPLPTREDFYVKFGTPPSYQLSFSIPFSSGREETSRNWSGLVTHATDDNPFTSVFGMWQVPAVSAPVGTSNGDFRCSTWIGLDGTKRSLPSMPQIGTTQRVEVVHGVAKIEFEAWSQWWALGGVTLIQPFNGFPIAVGDNVACSIDVVSPTSVNVAVTNITQGSHPYIRSMAPIIITPPNTAPIVLNPPVTGTTAEWIAERPRQFAPPMDLFPLPVFDRVTFAGATVTGMSGTQRGLGPVKVIRMVEPHAAPARLEVLSRARKAYLANGSEMAVAGPGLERQMCC